MTTQLSTLAADGSQSQYTPSTAPSDDISSIRDDFTVLFAQTGLPPSLHRSRTTQTGFRLDDRRLGQYLPAPPIKEINPSWIWEYGERLCDETDPPVRYWLCHRCFDSKPSKFQINNISKLTSGALKHLELKHNLVKGQQKIPITPTKRKNPFELIVDRVERARLETINPDEWKARFIKWVVVDNLSLRQASSIHLHELLECCRPSAGDLHYTSHNSVRSLIQSTVEQVRPQVLLNSPFFLPQKMPPSISPFHPADLEAKTKILPSGKLRKPENQHQLNKCKLQELVQFDCEVKGHKKHKNGIVVCAPIVRVFRR
ncbi:hypothetical protein D6D08_04013 [Aureobasidium pullulans]|nr:hypothetical protein D6D08_04013 [Aureobasidium pullulans]